MEDNKISLVVATYNSAEMLKRSLRENLKTGFAAIIIVDGGSTDSTKDEVKRFQNANPGIITFYQIPLKGLANARNFGNSKINTEFTVHAGPDNIISSETIEIMMDDLNKYDLVSCQTRRENASGYLGKAHNIYKKRYMPGLQTVAGTPYVGKTQLFQKFAFNERMRNSDDTELGQRLLDAGKTIFRSRAICLEIGFEGFKDIVERWIRWGRGDGLFYCTQKTRWSFRRKLYSWAHPLKAEILDSFKSVTLPEFIYITPFLLIVLSLRYFGWIRFVITGK